MAKISVLGAGSWGTALAILLEDNGHQVQVWSALEDEVEMLQRTHEHETKLPGVKISEAITFTGDLEGSVRGRDVVVLAVPSPFTRETAHKISGYVEKGQRIVNVAKGVEEGSLMTLSEIIEAEIPQADVAVLSGPSHAEEVGRRIPTTCVVSAQTRETAEYLQSIFMSPVFRVYTTPDMLGVELGAALKNVIALAAGTADGLGYGDNTKAALITRGVAEICRLGVHFLRPFRYGGSDRHLRQRTQPQPESGFPDRTGEDHGRGDERGQDGGGGRVLGESGQRPCGKIWDRDADRHGSV